MNEKNDLEMPEMAIGLILDLLPGFIVRIDCQNSLRLQHSFECSEAGVHKVWKAKVKNWRRTAPDLSDFGFSGKH